MEWRQVDQITLGTCIAIEKTNTTNACTRHLSYGVSKIRSRQSRNKFHEVEILSDISFVVTLAHYFFSCVTMFCQCLFFGYSHLLRSYFSWGILLFELSVFLLIKFSYDSLVCRGEGEGRSRCCRASFQLVVTITDRHWIRSCSILQWTTWSQNQSLEFWALPTPSCVTVY